MAHASVLYAIYVLDEHFDSVISFVWLCYVSEVHLLHRCFKNANLVSKKISGI